MKAWRTLLVAGACLSVVPVLGFSVGAQQTFPAAAVIRGENIWLRVDPAEDTEVVASLQRGDAVTMTGEAVAADGETFVPVDVDATGDVGWVRELAIDPRSVAESVAESVAVGPIPETRRDPRQPRAGRPPRDVTVAPVPVEPQTVAGDEQVPTRREPRPPRAGRPASAEGETPRPEKPQRLQVTPEPGGNCDPSYPDVCISPPPPDLDCPQVDDTDFAVLPPDSHEFDGDENGVGCEI